MLLLRSVLASAAEWACARVQQMTLRPERLNWRGTLSWSFRPVQAIINWEHSGFNFFAGEPIGAEDKDARLFLARYLKEAPLALVRMFIDESGTEPIVRYTKQLDDAEPNNEMMRTFTPLEFLAELSCHIPRVFEQATRFFGAYSPRTCGAKRRDEVSISSRCFPMVEYRYLERI